MATGGHACAATRKEALGSDHAAATTTLQHALADAPWREIEDAVQRSKRAGGRAFVFLDYDGTLAPLVTQPEHAFASAETLEALRGLHEIDKVIAAIVTGRNVDKARKFVGIDDLLYAGSHGLDIRSSKFPEVSLDVGAEHRTALEAAYRFSCDLVAKARFAGAVVEDNRYAVSLHYRNLERQDALPELLGHVQTWFEDALGPGARLQLKSGKCLVEFRPAAMWNKGEAVRHILHHFHASPSRDIVLVAGDDLTDEDMFIVVNEWAAPNRAAAVSVLVAEGVPEGSKAAPALVTSHRTTAAHSAVWCPDETRQLLERFRIAWASA